MYMKGCVNIYETEYQSFTFCTWRLQIAVRLGSSFITMSNSHDKPSLSTLKQPGCPVFKRYCAQVVCIGSETAKILSLKKKLDAKKSWKRSGSKESRPSISLLRLWGWVSQRAAETGFCLSEPVQAGSARSCPLISLQAGTRAIESDTL